MMPKQIHKGSPQNNSELTCQNILDSSELPFIAFCRVKYRLPLINIRKSESGRVNWTLGLQDKDETALFQEFHQGAMVPANEYFSELKSLKSTTYGL